MTRWYRYSPAVCGVLFLCGIVLAEEAATAEKKAASEDSGWVSLFDGTMDQWKASENKDSWKIEDGCLVCSGPRSHLFYTGDHAPFKNFAFKCKVKTLPKANAGIYFHTRYQEEGWPRFGYECQVNQTHGDPKKSSSLYGVENVADSGVEDGVWYTQEIIVKGKQIVLKINGKTMVDYTEPEDKEAFSIDFERRLQPEGGTFGLQAHDPESKAYFKDIMVKKLAD